MSDNTYEARRIFVGNLPTNQATEDDVKQRFAVYGRVLGVVLKQNYGFVQFEREDAAKEALEKEDGSVFIGQTLKVKPAKQTAQRPREEMDHRGGSHEDYRSRSPTARNYDDRGRYDRGGAGGRGDYDYRRNEPSEAPLSRQDVGIDRPFDAVIIVTNKTLKSYAEHVERKLIELNLTVDVIFLIQDDAQALERAIDDMIRRGLLYIVVLQSQHEKYRSLTVFMLHDAPQEHRHMPLQDALSMLSTNFQAYVNSLRIGSEQPSMGFLLNLLADGKHLSVDELDRIIRHLKARRERMVGGSVGTAQRPTEIEPAPQQQQFPTQQSVGQVQQTRAPEPQPQAPVPTAQDLQSKILSILGGGSKPPASSSTAAAPAPTSTAAPDWQRTLQQLMGTQQTAPQPQQSQPQQTYDPRQLAARNAPAPQSQQHRW